MTKDLAPRFPKEVFRSDGGFVELWSSDFEILQKANVGACKVTLFERGLLLPKYSDSPQICYVLEGCGKVGLVFPESPAECVKKVRKGDVVAIPEGTVNWWFNEGSSELVVLSMGDTSKGHKAGEYTDFYLVGTGSDRPCVLKGFTTDFIAQAWDIDEPTVHTLLDSQKGNTIVKLKEGLAMPEESKDLVHSPYGEFTYNCEDAKLDVDVKNGGRVAVVSSDNLPILKHLGLGADLVKLDAAAMCSPGFSSDTAYQVTYIARGSGRVQVVGNDGNRVIDTELKAGMMFIVPRFHIVSKRAGSEGLEWFSIITQEKPVFSHLAGRTGVMKSLSPQILCAAFNVGEDVEGHFRSRRTQDAIFFPPKN